MYVLSDAAEKYIADNSTAEDELLAKINRETHSEVLKPRMLSGHTQGIVLQMLSEMIKPKSILEVGTYTGYSAICLAKGLTSEGTLTTIDKNDELEDRVRAYFQEAGIATRTNYLLGDATKLIPDLDQTFDLIFIDADKRNYALYYDLIFDKVVPGGYILVDNVLWSGKVVDPSKQDKDTKAIRAFNKKLAEDSRIQVTILSVRDGITLARKLSS